MTVFGLKTLNVEKLFRKYLRLGVLLTNAGSNAITLLLMQFGLVNWFASLASGAAMSKALRTTKTMTNRLMSCGFANLAINSGTRKY
jgi:hypothetical protein